MTGSPEGQGGRIRTGTRCVTCGDAEAGEGGEHAQSLGSACVGCGIVCGGGGVRVCVRACVRVWGGGGVRACVCGCVGVWVWVCGCVCVGV